MRKPARSVLATFFLSSVVAVGCTSASGLWDEMTAPAASDLAFGAPLGPEPRGVATRHPIVLVSGFGTSPTFITFRGVANALRRDGHRVRVADIPPVDSTAVRGAALAREIDAALEQLGASKVNLIAHSAGGTAAREAISKLGYGDRVASVTTISTAHHGTPLADMVLDTTKKLSDETLDAIATFFGERISDLGSNSHFRASFESMAVRNMAAFDASHPDDPRVYYQSWAGIAGLFGHVDPEDDIACEGKRFGGKRVNGAVHAVIVPMAIAIGDRPQDGLVPVESAKHGVFRGCLPADHLDEIGGMAGRPAVDHRTGFDHVRFFRLTAYELSAKGL